MSTYFVIMVILMANVLVFTDCIQLTTNQMSVCSGNNAKDTDVRKFGEKFAIQTSRNESATNACVGSLRVGYHGECQPAWMATDISDSNRVMVQVAVCTWNGTSNNYPYSPKMCVTYNPSTRKYEKWVYYEHLNGCYQNI